MSHGGGVPRYAESHCCATPIRLRDRSLSSRQPTLRRVEARTVVILADDLMWATRLGDLVRRVGWEPRHVASLLDLGAALAVGGPLIVDLTARVYDGVSAVEMAA